MKKNNTVYGENKKIKTRIYIKATGLQIIVISIMSFLSPRLLNYPPFSEDPVFQRSINVLPHNVQYLMLGLIGLITEFLFIHFIFRDVFKYLDKSANKVSIPETKHVRNVCFNAPGKLLYSQLIMLLILFFALFHYVKINITLSIKFIMVYFSFFISAWALSTTILKSDLNLIIGSTYNINKEVTLPKKRTKYYITLIKNLIPFFIAMLITISLLGYSKVIDTVGENRYNYYKNIFTSIDLNYKSIDDVKNTLGNIELVDNSNYYFIITNNSKYFSKNNGYATNFFISYAEHFINKTHGRIYEYFGVSEEAYGQIITLDNGQKALVGIKYATGNYPTAQYYILVSIICSLIYATVLFVWSKNMSKNITAVSIRLSEISKHYDVNKKYDVLPAYSNDEIGELVIAFNNIQQTTKDNIEQIHNGQNMLMERERLATLGQMVGGIAHNLKTPIMSISGAMEGLSDLITEYDESIDDPEVTKEDHHAIANDMKEWVKKVNSYDDYMSDIITAVKGQAVNFNNSTIEKFTLDDLLKDVNILMKHELKNALITLNINCKIDKDTQFVGNINALVQVINNLISNAIQSYNGKQNESIDLTIYKNNNNIMIDVTDHGCGIPEDVQKQLFSKMITTKGHNGSGLGLFMSYSTIKGNFNGNLSFTSKVNVGTTFTISLPISK